MSDWSLPKILSGLHDDIQSKLAISRANLAHPGTKGNASEAIWLRMLQTYLPVRYCTESAHVVDSNGQFSDQIDVVIFDRQYTPFIFNFEGAMVVPAESVYAVFEAKQAINAEQVDYAHKKIKSVRELHRTSLRIPYAGGTYDPKPLPHILGGLLTFESDWSPGLGDALTRSLNQATDTERIDLGCVAAHGVFDYSKESGVDLSPMAKPATAFLFELIARLQQMATVPMIDVRAYAKWLDVDLD